ncbi:MAG: CmpA/NrtA family ABC transporter substrate-binding protein [Pseudomonadota bacterium]
MSQNALRCGFIPLVDAAPLIVAHEMGFAAEQGIELVLEKQPSWSALRDMLVLERIEAAHMLAPVPVAMALGLGGLPTRIDALMVLSVNGNTIGVSRALSARMRDNGWTGDFLDPTGTGQHMIRATERRLRVGVPFPFSMHAELLYYWLGALGMTTPDELDVRTVPPPQMAAAMAEGEIDAFCVGEPWGSIAVEGGIGDLVLPGSAIWRFAPEKVLAVRRDWAANNDTQTGALMRAVSLAARWLSQPENRMIASEFLARPDYLNISDNVIDRALRGKIVTSPTTRATIVPGFLHFYTHCANFPWRSQAAWIAERLARRTGLDRRASIAAGAASFRPDIYRRHLAPLGLDMPGASAKVEGALAQTEPVASTHGQINLGPDSFFDGVIFDPDAL